MESVINIAALRKSLKIKQEDMANILGINQSQVSEMERGIRPISAKYEEVLVDQFGKELCDNFRISSQDNRRLSVKGNVSVNGNGSIQDSNKEIRGGNELKSKEHDELIKIREEVKYLRELIADKDRRIAELTASLDRERKMNDYLMNQK